MVSKKELSRQIADIATMTTSVATGSCGSGKGCDNQPAFRVGSTLLCEACVTHARLSYPASFAAYWEHKLVPLPL